MKSTKTKFWQGKIIKEIIWHNTKYWNSTTLTDVIIVKDKYSLNIHTSSSYQNETGPFLGRPSLRHTRWEFNSDLYDSMWLYLELILQSKITSIQFLKIKHICIVLNYRNIYHFNFVNIYVIQFIIIINIKISYA